MRHKVSFRIFQSSRGILEQLSGNNPAEIVIAIIVKQFIHFIHFIHVCHNRVM